MLLQGPRYCCMRHCRTLFSFKLEARISLFDGRPLIRAWDIVSSWCLSEPGNSNVYTCFLWSFFFTAVHVQDSKFDRRSQIHSVFTIAINHNKDRHKTSMCVWACEQFYFGVNSKRCLTKIWLISPMQMLRTYLLNRISVKYQWCVKARDGQFIFCIFASWLAFYRLGCISGVYSVILFVCIDLAAK